MNIKKYFLSFMLLGFFAFSYSAKRPVNFLVVDNTLTMEQSDYQTIVDYVNTNLTNTHSYPANSDNYYGTSAYYTNFDVRSGSYNAAFANADEAITEALATVLLPAKFPNSNLNESFEITYATYSGVNGSDSKRFYCSSISPLSFTSIVPAYHSMVMDSLDYQYIVDYVNANLSNTHKYSATAEDHYGASSYFKNFDARDGNYNAAFASSDAAIKEALSEVFLLHEYADAIKSDTFTIHYASYNGVDAGDSMIFVCESESPLSFLLLGEEAPPSNDFENLSFGSDSTFDVITWNIEHFPKNGSVTMDKVKEALVAMDAEVVAFQEIDDTAMFRQMVDELQDYEAIIGNYGYAPMCYIYKTASVQVNGTDQLFENDGSAFPREPFVLDLTFSNEQFIIICNHLKCCGDGVLDENNSNDEENRRLKGIIKLKDYIDNNWSDKNVLVLGDFNDVLEDEDDNNVFKPFIDDASNYVFADMSISLGPSTHWSYPSWPSDLDHILITNELFDRTEAQTILVDEHITWSAYDRDMSDHRPVGINVLIDSSVTTSSDMLIFDNIMVSPNPVEEYVSIRGIPQNTSVGISLYSQNGQLMISENANAEAASSIDMSNLPSGIYLLSLNANAVKKNYKIVKH